MSEHVRVKSCAPSVLPLASATCVFLGWLVGTNFFLQKFIPELLIVFVSPASIEGVVDAVARDERRWAMSDVDAGGRAVRDENATAGQLRIRDILHEHGAR